MLQLSDCNKTEYFIFNRVNIPPNALGIVSVQDTLMENSGPSACIA